VKYKNELNTIPLRKFNSKEMDLFFSICSKMKNKSTNTVRFNFDDLKTLSAYKMTATNHFVKDLESVYDKMLDLKYRVEDEEGSISKFILFPDYKINPKKKFVDISVHPQLEHVLNQFTNEFTQFELQEFTSLKSSYSKTMYRLLKQFKNTGYYTVKIKDFRELFDIPVSYRMREIDTRVLNPINKELTNYFDSFKIKKIKEKKGNRIERLEVLFHEKQLDETLPHVPLYNWLED